MHGLIFAIVIVCLPLFMALPVFYFIVRARWVGDERERLLFQNYREFKALPSFHYMCYTKWWCWDIDRFKQPSS